MVVMDWPPTAPAVAKKHHRPRVRVAFKKRPGFFWRKNEHPRKNRGAAVSASIQRKRRVGLDRAGRFFDGKTPEDNRLPHSKAAFAVLPVHGTAHGAIESTGGPICSLNVDRGGRAQRA